MAAYVEKVVGRVELVGQDAEEEEDIADMIAISLVVLTSQFLQYQL